MEPGRILFFLPGHSNALHPRLRKERTRRGFGRGLTRRAAPGERATADMASMPLCQPPGQPSGLESRLAFL
jgi:hypothetical protein